MIDAGKELGPLVERIGPPPDTHCWDDDSATDCWSYSPQMVAELLAAERERCAAIAESWATEETSTTCANVAAAIRRANAKGGQKTMKIETGVMIIKDGKAWGIIYEDGYSTSYGWIAPENAPIHNPKFLKRPEDVTYRESRYVVELRSAKLVQVERRTEVILKS